MDRTATIFLAVGFLAGFAVEWAYDFFVARRRRTSSTDPELKLSLEKALAENKELSGQVASLGPFQRLFESKQSEFEERMLEVSRANASIADPNYHLEQLKQELEAKDEVIAGLRMGLGEPNSDSTLVRIGRLHELAGQYEQTMATMKCELKELETKVNGFESGHHNDNRVAIEPDEETDVLRANVDARNQEISNLRKDLEGAKSQMIEQENARVLKSLNEALERDVESLRVVSAAKDQAVTESQAALAHLEAQLAFRPRLEDLERLQEKLKEREQVIEAHSAEFAELKAQLGSRNQEVETLGSQMREFQEVSQTRAEDADSLRANLEARSLALNELTSKIASLEEAAQAHPEEIERMSALLAEMHNAINELESRPDPAIAYGQVKRLEAELDQRNQTLETLQSRIGKLMRSLVETEPVPEPIAEIQVQPQVFEPAPISVAPSSPRLDSSPHHDPLIQINGIGHLFERKLWEAGISTFAQLAALSTDEVFEIIQPAEWQQIEPGRWISDAARRSLGTGT